MDDFDDDDDDDLQLTPEQIKQLKDAIRDFEENIAPCKHDCNPILIRALWRKWATGLALPDAPGVVLCNIPLSLIKSRYQPKCR